MNKYKLKRRVALICIFTTIITLLHAVIIPDIKASYNIESADIYIKGRADDLLLRNGSPIGCTITMYQKDGIEYPAYCLEREKPGVRRSARLYSKCRWNLIKCSYMESNYEWISI